MTDALTKTETKSLSSYEQVIERGLSTFVDVGNALMAIREGKLYRKEYKTFDAYCLDRWEFKRQNAYQLMDAASVVENVRQGVQIAPPTCEKQARPLAKLPALDQAEAWTQAVEHAESEGRKVTAKDVESVVAEMMPPKEQKAEKKEPKAFDKAVEGFRLMDVVRKQIERWPEELQEMAIQLVRQVMKEFE